MTRHCIAKNQKTGLPCQAKPMRGSEYCHAHNPSSERKLMRKRIAKTAGEGYKGLASLSKYEVGDSEDVAEAVRLVIQDFIRRGLRSSKINQFARLTELYMKLESNAIVPRRLKELQKLIDSKKLEEGTGVQTSLTGKG